MISSSSGLPLERALDTMLLVYSFLQGHPARAACEQFLRGCSGWFTSPWVLFEARAVLTKVYGEDSAVTTQKLVQVAGGPVALLELDPAEVPLVLGLADTYSLDVTDAVLLRLTQQQGAKLVATEDQRLAQVCTRLGVTPISPIDATLRQAVSTWEAAHVPPKGLQRVLRQVYRWLNQSHPQAAQDFWSRSGGGSHLP